MSLQYGATPHLARVCVGARFECEHCGDGILSDFTRIPRGVASGAVGQCQCGASIAISETGAVTFLSGEKPISSFGALPEAANDN